jgi:hypothetical protein
MNGEFVNLYYMNMFAATIDTCYCTGLVNNLTYVSCPQNEINVYISALYLVYIDTKKRHRRIAKHTNKHRVRQTDFLILNT